MRNPKLQAPGSKEAPGLKFQGHVTSVLDIRGRPQPRLVLTPYWNLELEVSLELGAWSLGFRTSSHD
jgi:hypothetical protein